MQVEDFSISNNLFEVAFSNFKGLREPDYDILRDTFKKINKTSINFELIETNKKIEPLELLTKLTSNKISGDMIISMMNKHNEVLGKIVFNKISFTFIDGLIDFDFGETDIKEKNIIVSYECNDKFYVGKNGKEEKLIQ